MLSKKICQKCSKWGKRDRERWQMGFVCCIVTKGNTTSGAIISIKEVPEWCPYALEHIVKDEK